MWLKSGKNDERFSGLAAWNFTKPQVNVVKLSLQDKVCFRISKSFPVSAQRPPTDFRRRFRKMGKNVLFFPLNLIGNKKLEKLTRHTSCAPVSWFSAVFSESVFRNKRKRKTQARWSTYWWYWCVVFFFFFKQFYVFYILTMNLCLK